VILKKLIQERGSDKPYNLISLAGPVDIRIYVMPEWFIGTYCNSFHLEVVYPLGKLKAGSQPFDSLDRVRNNCICILRQGSELVLSKSPIKSGKE
jgi:hypothetical protein